MHNGLLLMSFIYSCNNDFGYDKYREVDFSSFECTRIQTRGMKGDTIVYVIDFPKNTLNNSGYGVYVSKDKTSIYRIEYLGKKVKNENILETKLDSLISSFLQYDLRSIYYEIEGDVCIGIDKQEDIYCKCMQGSKLKSLDTCELDKWYIKK